MLQLGELLLNPHASRIVKENLQKKGVRVSSVTHDNVVRVGNCPENETS